jgi:DNA-binding MarR family transcriptional regulator
VPKRAREPGAATGLTAPQLSVLLAIALDPGLEQKALAERVSFDPVILGGILQRLDTLGLIERAASERSRRGRRVFLSDAGQAFVLGHYDAVLRIQDRLLERPAGGERRQLVDLLRKALGLAVRTGTAASTCARTPCARNGRP